MVNYANSKVYKIWSTQGDKIYVGSTTKQYLSQRMDKHRSDYKRWKDGKCRSITSFKLFDEYGLENCFIELIEAKECNSKDELHKLEGKYIRELNCVNKNVAGRTQQEYYDDNKEHIKEKSRQHYHDNKDYALDRNKQYYEANKDAINENKKIYYEQTKEYQSSLKNQVVQCSCGKAYTHSNRVRHQKSAFHINNKKELIKENVKSVKLRK
jgi:hypothetical protein